MPLIANAVFAKKPPNPARLLNMSTIREDFLREQAKAIQNDVTNAMRDWDQAQADLDHAKAKGAWLAMSAPAESKKTK